jgi:hypothetical protein
MPDRSSSQGLPDDWSRDGYAVPGQHSGAGATDGYGAGMAGSHGARATDGYGSAATEAYRTGADAYRARTGDPFGGAADQFGTAADPFGAPADPFGAPADSFGAGAGGSFGAGAGGSFGAGAGGSYGAAEAQESAEADGPQTATMGRLNLGGHADSKGFLGALFDFSFSSFATPKLIRVLYLLITIGTVVAALVFTIIMFRANVMSGVLTLIFADPLFILIVMAAYRIILEFFIVTLRIAEDVRTMRDRGGLG